MEKYMVLSIIGLATLYTAVLVSGLTGAPLSMIAGFGFCAVGYSILVAARMITDAIKKN